MSIRDQIPIAVQRKFDVFDWRNALSLLHSVHRTEWDELMSVLSAFELRWSQLVE